MLQELAGRSLQALTPKRLFLLCTAMSDRMACLSCRCHAHPNIVQLKEVFLTTHYLAIVMEYMKGSNMPTYLAKHAPLPEPVARCVMLTCLLDTGPFGLRSAQVGKLSVSCRYMPRPAHVPFSWCTCRLDNADEVCFAFHRWFFQQLVLVFDFYHRLGLKNREVTLHMFGQPSCALSSFPSQPLAQVS